MLALPKETFKVNGNRPRGHEARQLCLEDGDQDGGVVVEVEQDVVHVVQPPLGRS